MSLSRSTDLENWEFCGSAAGGENACVLVHDGKYLLIHSPENGIGIKESTDLKSWDDKGVHMPNYGEGAWATGRLTAGFATEAHGGTKYKYIMFYHASRKESSPETHGDATLAMAFTDDFETYSCTPY